jgi:hypothetical protein
LAALGAVRARIAVARAAGYACPGDRIIDDAIAIVVYVIASLGLRIDVARARDYAVGALSRAQPTRRGRALAARLANAGQVVVDDAIAVIILAIAGFRLGVCCSATYDCPKRAYRFTFSALTNTAAAVTSYVVREIVDEAVAVVVFAVTGFCDLRNTTGTHHRIGVSDCILCTTGRSECAAVLQRTTSFSQPSNVIVDLTVAIVVDAVASFSLRFHAAKTQHLAIGTL